MKKKAKETGMKRKINETLAELMAGIVLWGAFWQAAGVWFVPGKLYCSAGLWCGVAVALICAVHMYKALDRALDLSEKDAQKYITGRSMMRYGFIIIVLLILMITRAGEPLCCFLGIMGLKTAAYLQPFLHKVMKKRRR